MRSSQAADISMIGYLYYPPEEFGFDIAAQYRNISAMVGSAPKI